VDLWVLFHQRFKEWAAIQDDLGMIRHWVGADGNFHFNLDVTVPELMVDFKQELLRDYPALRGEPCHGYDLSWDTEHALGERFDLIEQVNIADSQKCEKLLEAIRQAQPAMPYERVSSVSLEG
jgi:hypothetical protein